MACDGVLPSGMSEGDGLRGTSASTPIESDMVGDYVLSTIFQDHSVGQHAAVELRRTVPHSVNEARRL